MLQSPGSRAPAPNSHAGTPCAPPEQLTFDLVARREVAMATLARERAMILTIPVKARLAEPGFRGESPPDFPIVGCAAFSTVKSFWDSIAMPNAFASRSLMRRSS